uniref:Chitin-binding type-1 domain-containing protein n=1 Tax=Heterorhabditis bacteriophora TaxID=37862 RepID=A0A1I7WRD5_HETBA
MNVHATLKYYSCQLRATNKINMGVPFYGRFWQNVGDAVDPADDMWRTAFPSDGGIKFEVKINYLIEQNLGGVMIWAVDFDDDNLSLLKAATEDGLCLPSKFSPDFKYKCSPISDQRWWTYDDDKQDMAGMCGRSAPLYNGYYPVCDPDDPGHACCGRYGYCGSGPEFCECPECIDYKNITW